MPGFRVSSPWELEGRWAEVPATHTLPAVWPCQWYTRAGDLGVLTYAPDAIPSKPGAAAPLGPPSTLYPQKSKALAGWILGCGLSSM